MQKDKKNGAWLPRVALFLGSIVFILITIAIVKETYKKRQVQAEIDKLKEKAQQIEGGNSRLKERIAYLESSDYQQKEVKDKLSLQEQGENVVVFKSSPIKEDKPASSPPPEEQKIIIKKSNPQKWFDYFF